MNRFLRARELARLWSMHVLAAAATLYALLLAFPDQALSIWQALPPEVQAMVPHRDELALFLFVAAAIARALKQKSGGQHA